eukprot:scaffold2261_cov231-Pinguiococcus_pyrenoidosus.AAC.1
MQIAVTAFHFSTVIAYHFSCTSVKASPPSSVAAGLAEATWLAFLIQSRIPFLRTPASTSTHATLPSRALGGSRRRDRDAQLLARKLREDADPELQLRLLHGPPALLPASDLLCLSDATCPWTRGGHDVFLPFFQRLHVSERQKVRLLLQLVRPFVHLSPNSSQLFEALPHYFDVGRGRLDLLEQILELPFLLLRLLGPLAHPIALRGPQLLLRCLGLRLCFLDTLFCRFVLLLHIRFQLLQLRALLFGREQHFGQLSLLLSQQFARPLENPGAKLRLAHHPVRGLQTVAVSHRGDSHSVGGSTIFSKKHGSHGEALLLVRSCEVFQAGVVRRHPNERPGLDAALHHGLRQRRSLTRISPRADLVAQEERPRLGAVNHLLERQAVRLEGGHPGTDGLLVADGCHDRCEDVDARRSA